MNTTEDLELRSIAKFLILNIVVNFFTWAFVVGTKIEGGIEFYFLMFVMVAPASCAEEHPRIAATGAALAIGLLAFTVAGWV